MFKRYLILLTLALIIGVGFGDRVEAAFNYAPVAFVVVDDSKNMTQEDFLSWREQVRQAYYMPHYEIIKSTEPDKVVFNYLQANGLNPSKLEKEDLQAIGADAAAKVVVLLIVNRFDERLVPSFGRFWYDRGDLLKQVVVSADIYVYKEEGDKFLNRKIRYFETDDVAISEAPTDIVKYRLRRVVNEMENREQI